MALPNSGSISLADIQNEFGGSNPIGLNEYYRNGSYVTPNNTNIPTSGLIDFNDFYGAETATFISGSGGSVTTSGDYKIHTFTSSGTMTFSQVGTAAVSNTAFTVLELVTFTAGSAYLLRFASSKISCTKFPVATPWLNFDILFAKILRLTIFHIDFLNNFK